MIHVAGAGTPAGHKEVLAGRYRLVRRLAEGGMATVWEGRDEVLARPVAIKIPHSLLAADPMSRERFRREAVAAARLAHPGIVATYDTGVDGTIDFIVMELVAGRTLSDLVAHGPVSVDVAVALAAQVADALDAAHAAGLVHRDIKPANLLLVEEGPRPAGAPERPHGPGSTGPALRVKVADFGVARAQEVLDQRMSGASVTREGVVVGTARYLAPEQVAATALDGRTDLYALGCVLHELLAGQPPFVRDTDLAIALAHLTEAPPPLRSLGVPVDAAVEALVLACLAKDPADRPASGHQLAQQLRALSLPLGGDARADTVAPPTAPVPLLDPPGRTIAPTQAGLPGLSGPTKRTTPGLSGPTERTTPGLSGPTEARAAPRSGGDRPRPTPAAPRPSRSRVPLVVVGGLVLAALATALAVVALPPSTPTTDRTGGVATDATPEVLAVRAFDPAPGDGRENDDQLSRLTDDDLTTTWSSDRYRQPPVFGNLKKGVGVVLVLRQPARVGQLRVRSASQGWAVQVYLADSPAPTLSGWGQPAARAADVDGDVALDLAGRSGSAILVWFTHPGRTGQVVVGDIEAQAP